MANKGHVPKFGNWDGDNVPYSSYFENAGKGKGTNGKAFNPNDPQENSGAFLSGIFPSEPEVRKSRENSPTGYGTVSPSEYEGRKSRDSSSNNFRIVSNSEYEGRKSRHSSSKDYRIMNNSEYEGRKSRESSSPNDYRIVNNSEYSGRKSRESSTNDYRTVNNSEYTGRKSRESSSNNYRTVNNSEHGGRKSRDSSSNDYRTARRQQNKYGSKGDTEFGQRYMDTPPRGKNQRNGNSGYRSNRSPESTPERYRASTKQPEESSFSMLAPSPCRSGLKAGRLDDAMHDAPSSVPRFGSWDDTNPDSGDGFTKIFNKVKQEKKTAAAKVPRVPPAAPKVHPSLRGSHARSSSKSKKFCCLYTPTRD